MSDEDDDFAGVEQVVDTKTEGSFLEKSVIQPLADFVRDSSRFLNGCERPDRKEYAKIVQHIGMGFLMMGVTSFLVKIIHIPVTNILL